MRHALVAACLMAAFSAGGAVAADGPRLDAVRCTPAAGTTSTVFCFSIVYYGAAEPSGHDVHIDSFGTGSIFAMTKVGPGPHGGTLYAYSTRLSAGTHRYRFRLKVGDLVLRKPGPSGSSWYNGPTVTASTTSDAVPSPNAADDLRGTAPN